MKTRDTLVLSVKGMIHKIALRYRKQIDHDFEDLVQQGYIGAMKAADRYDPELGASFCGFAMDYIRNSIVLYIRQTQGIIPFLSKGTGQPYSKIYFNMFKMPVKRRADITHSMCVEMAKSINVDTQDVIDYLNLHYIDNDSAPQHSRDDINDNTCELYRLDRVMNAKFSPKQTEAFGAWVQGYDYPEVAKKVGMSRTWTASLMLGIKKELNS